MAKLKYIFVGVILIAAFAIWYFNLSLTSLPTAFSNVVSDNVPKGKTVEQVKQIEIRQGGIVTEDLEYIPPDNGSVLTIEDPTDIKQIVNSDLSVYHGGRVSESVGNAYILFVRFDDGTEQQYNVTNEYIEVSIPNNYKQYKVMDSANDVYEYLENLFREQG